MMVFFEDPTNNFAADFNNSAPATPPAGPDDGAAPQTVPPSSADVSTGPYATEEAFIALARDGAHFWTLGFAGKPGEGWQATSYPFFGFSDNVISFFDITSGSAPADFNSGLTRLFNGNAGIADSVRVPAATPSVFGAPVEFAFSGQLKGVFDLNTPFEIASNMNLSFQDSVCTGRIGDYVWKDVNKDGCQDPNEPAIEGVEVILFEVTAGTCGDVQDRIEMARTTTDADGLYIFENLCAGDYEVEFVTPDGFVSTTPNNPLCEDPADENDSDCAEEPPCTTLTTDDSEDLTIDCGYEEVAECELELDKTCCIPPPPPAEDFVCSDAKPFETLTLVWGGAQVIDIVTEGNQVINGIKPEDVVVLDVAGLGNDVDVDITFADGTTRKSRFHVSCSDDEMNGPEDCGSNQGNGKDNKSEIDGVPAVNAWLFEGLASPDGVLQCTPPDPDDQTETRCAPDSPEPFVCSDAKPFETLTLKWDGVDDINIVVEGNQAINGIEPGGVVVLNVAGLGNDVDVDITFPDGSTGKSRFHVSCSDNEMNGPEDCGTNQGNGKDNKSEIDGVPTVNTWLFEGLASPDGELVCTPPDPDSLFKDECLLELPPPPPFDCDAAKPFDTLTLKWDGVSGIHILTEGNQEILNIQNGQVVDLMVAGLGNDVDVDITFPDNTIAKSRFHVSCSDDAMDGPEDCGTNQGNGKDNKTEIDGVETSNNWLFEGLASPEGELVCTPANGLVPAGLVEYQYLVTNPVSNTRSVTVRVEDIVNVNDPGSPVLTIGEDILLAPGEFIMLFNTRQVFAKPDDETTITNKATAFDQDDVCAEAMDTVDVIVSPPPPPPVSCSDIKDITEVSVIWTGLGPIDVVMESGEMFKNVQPGNKITFQEADTGNDVEMTIYDVSTGQFVGESKFHVSCSDPDMNGSEDCNTFQGNGKDDDSSLVNLWLLDGMTGVNGSFECGLDHTGVVDPTPGGNVTGAATLDLGDNKKVKWALTNNGTQDVFLTEAEIAWPDLASQHDQLKKCALAGDFAKDVFADMSPTVLPDHRHFEDDPNKRKLKPGETKTFFCEFVKEFDDKSQRVPGDFEITVWFDNGQMLSIAP
jgi:hypothetical protein